MMHQLAKKCEAYGWSRAAFILHGLSLQKRFQFPSIGDMDRWMDLQLSGTPTYTGRAVTNTTAMQVSAYWACVRVLSGDFAKLPLYPVRRTGPDSKEIATDHYLYKLLNREANPEMSAFRFRQLMQSWAVGQGNAYAEITISGRNQVTELWPWRPDRVTLKRVSKGGPLAYIYRLDDGEEVTLPKERVLHIRGLSCDGLIGYNPVHMHRQRLGMSQAVEEHGARFFANGARPLGVLEHPEVLGPDGVKGVREMWEATHGGLSNAHRVAILEEGMKYHDVGLSMVDAQYLDVMKYGVTDIARIMGVPPHRIADLDRSTNNNIEHQGIEYVLYGIGPWVSNWESELVFALLSAREAETISVEADYSELLRGDSAAQAEYWKVFGNLGWVAADEGRRKIGMNPMPNGWGSKPRVPINTMWVDEERPTSGAGAAAKDDEEPKEPPQRYLNGHANGVTHGTAS